METSDRFRQLAFSGMPEPVGAPQGPTVDKTLQARYDRRDANRAALKSMGDRMRDHEMGYRFSNTETHPATGLPVEGEIETSRWIKEAPNPPRDIK